MGSTIIQKWGLWKSECGGDVTLGSKKVTQLL